MIPTIIVLLVIALALGGYITFDFLKGKKKSSKNVVADVSPENSEEAATIDTDNSSENVVADSSPENSEEAAVIDTDKPVESVVVEEAAPTPQPETEIMEDKESRNDETDQPEAEMKEAEESQDEEMAQVVSVTENGKTKYIVIKYSKSYLAKLIQSNDETKSYYSQLKNCLLSYDGIKSRISWKWESFRLGRKTLAKLRFCGKTLSLCLALNAEEYANSRYKVESLAEVKAYEDTPCMYRIKNDRRLKYSIELIAALMYKNGLTKKNLEEIDYTKDYPYETTEALLECKLIKELTTEDAQSGTAFRPSVSAQEVDSLMQDEVATMLIKKSDVKSDKTKTGLVNIDTLSEHFESGEIVTLDEIKKRIKGFNKQTTYLKVLARGTLDKQLTVEADSFSLQAVKMIVLTGGTVIKR